MNGTIHEGSPARAYDISQVDVTYTNMHGQTQGRAVRTSSSITREPTECGGQAGIQSVYLVIVCDSDSTAGTQKHPQSLN